MIAFRFRHLLLAAVVATCFAASITSAKQVVLTLKDGRKVNGELVSETPNGVVVKIANIATTFPRNMIARVDTKLTLTEQYEQQLARLAKDDIAGRYKLAQWLFEQGEPTATEWSNKEKDTADKLAVKQLDWLLKDDPRNMQAKMLRGMAIKRIQDRQISQTTAATATTPKPSTGTSSKRLAVPTKAMSKNDLLNAQQVNLLKIYEIDLGTKPKIVLPPASVKKLFDDQRYRADPALASFQGRNGEARFRNLPGHEQLAILFELRARDMYGDAVVRTEPQPLKEFRTKINPQYIVRYCGECHAYGKEDHPPVFFTRKPNSEEAAYTNFLLLSRMTGGARHMIDRQDAAESLLLQFGLPRTEAKFPHPEVKGMKQYFTGTKDRRYLDMVNWVKKLYFPAPNYPISYTLPTKKVPAAPRAKAPAKTAPAKVN